MKHFLTNKGTQKEGAQGAKGPGDLTSAQFPTPDSHLRELQASGVIPD